MSKERMPVLAGTVPVFELFMSKWEAQGQRFPHLSRYTDEGLFWAYKYYKKMDLTDAYIIAMCKLMCFLCNIHLKSLQLSIHVSACAGLIHIGAHVSLRMLIK